MKQSVIAALTILLTFIVIRIESHRQIASADGRNYFASNHPKRTWYEAKNFCEQNGMTLAAIETVAQAKALKSAWVLPLHFTDSYWTAARDAHTTTKFIWDSTGKPADNNVLELINEDGYRKCGNFWALPQSSSKRNRIEFIDCQTRQNTLCQAGKV